MMRTRLANRFAILNSILIFPLGFMALSAWAWFTLNSMIQNDQKILENQAQKTAQEWDNWVEQQDFLARSLTHFALSRFGDPKKVDAWIYEQLKKTKEIESIQILQKSDQNWVSLHQWTTMDSVAFEKMRNSLPFQDSKSDFQTILHSDAQKQKWMRRRTPFQWMNGPSGEYALETFVSLDQGIQRVFQNTENSLSFVDPHFIFLFGSTNAPYQNSESLSQLGIPWKTQRSFVFQDGATQKKFLGGAAKSLQSDVWILAQKPVQSLQMTIVKWFTYGLFFLSALWLIISAVGIIWSKKMIGKRLIQIHQLLDQLLSPHQNFTWTDTTPDELGQIQKKLLETQKKIFELQNSLPIWKKLKNQMNSSLDPTLKTTANSNALMLWIETSSLSKALEKSGKGRSKILKIHEKLLQSLERLAQDTSALIENMNLKNSILIWGFQESQNAPEKIAEQIGVFRKSLELLTEEAQRQKINFDPPRIVFTAGSLDAIRGGTAQSQEYYFVGPLWELTQKLLQVANELDLDCVFSEKLGSDLEKEFEMKKISLLDEDLKKVYHFVGVKSANESSTQKPSRQSYKNQHQKTSSKRNKKVEDSELAA